MRGERYQNGMVILLTVLVFVAIPLLVNLPRGGSFGCPSRRPSRSSRRSSSGKWISARALDLRGTSGRRCPPPCGPQACR